MSLQSIRRSKAPSEKTKFFWLAIALFLLLSSTLFLSHLYFKNKFFINVKGTSMEGTLHNGDLVLLKKTNLEKNKIVIFTKPAEWSSSRGEKEELIKRVVALPGDNFTIENKQVKVNGRKIFDLTSIDCAANKNYSVKIPKDYFIAFGDNAKVSLDSRRQYCVGKTNNILIKTSNIVNVGAIVGKL